MQDSFKQHNIDTLRAVEKKGFNIEEIEGVLNLSLENPLSLLGVKGYDEEPTISNITVTVFLFVNLEDSDFSNFSFQGT